MRKMNFRIAAAIAAMLSTAAAASEPQDVIVKAPEVEVRLALDTISVEGRTESDDWAREPVYVQTAAIYDEPRNLPRTQGVKIVRMEAHDSLRYRQTSDTWLFDCGSNLAQHVARTYVDPDANQIEVARYDAADEYGPAGRIFVVQPGTTIAVIRERACEKAEQLRVAVANKALMSGD